MGNRKKNPFKVDEKSFGIRSKAMNRPVPAQIVNESTGEVMSGFNISFVKKEADMKRFVKVYDVCTLENLSVTGFKLLLYVIRFIGYDNRVLLSKDYFKKHFKYKQVRSYYNAIDELIDAQVIKKDEGVVYWVNPNIICKGIRKYEK